MMKILPWRHDNTLRFSISRHISYGRSERAKQDEENNNNETVVNEITCVVICNYLYTFFRFSYFFLSFFFFRFPHISEEDANGQRNKKHIKCLHHYINIGSTAVRGTFHVCRKKKLANNSLSTFPSLLVVVHTLLQHHSTFLICKRFFFSVQRARRKTGQR